MLMLNSTHSAFKKHAVTSEHTQTILLPASTGSKYVKLSLNSYCSFVCLYTQEVGVAQAGSGHPLSGLLWHAGSLSERLSVRLHSAAEST